MSLWAAQWKSKNLLEERTHIIYEEGLPKLFRTRQACRDFINKKYGYIKNRPDLRGEPHGWQVPRPVRVRIILK